MNVKTKVNSVEQKIIEGMKVYYFDAEDLHAPILYNQGLRDAMYYVICVITDAGVQCDFRNLYEVLGWASADLDYMRDEHCFDFGWESQYITGYRKMLAFAIDWLHNYK